MLNIHLEGKRFAQVIYRSFAYRLPDGIFPDGPRHISLAGVQTVGIFDNPRRTTVVASHKGEVVAQDRDHLVLRLADGRLVAIAKEVVIELHAS